MILNEQGSRAEAVVVLESREIRQTRIQILTLGCESWAASLLGGLQVHTAQGSQWRASECSISAHPTPTCCTRPTQHTLRPSWASIISVITTAMLLFSKQDSIGCNLRMSFLVSFSIPYIHSSPSVSLWVSNSSRDRGRSRGNLFTVLLQTSPQSPPPQESLPWLPPKTNQGFKMTPFQSRPQVPFL